VILTRVGYPGEACTGKGPVKPHQPHDSFKWPKTDPPISIAAFWGVIIFVQLTGRAVGEESSCQDENEDELRFLLFQADGSAHTDFCGSAECRVRSAYGSTGITPSRCNRYSEPPARHSLDGLFGVACGLRGDPAVSLECDCR
jgi:hypothetical protein